MTKIKFIKNDSAQSPEQCLVCGDIARGLNFNLMTCMACKTFFRKNVFKRLVRISSGKIFFFSSSSLECQLCIGE